MLRYFVLRYLVLRYFEPAIFWLRYFGTGCDILRLRYFSCDILRLRYFSCDIFGCDILVWGGVRYFVAIFCCDILVCDIYVAIFGCDILVSNIAGRITNRFKSCIEPSVLGLLLHRLAADYRQPYRVRTVKRVYHTGNH